MDLVNISCSETDEFLWDSESSLSTFSGNSFTSSTTIPSFNDESNCNAFAVKPRTTRLRRRNGSLARNHKRNFGVREFHTGSIDRNDDFTKYLEKVDDRQTFQQYLAERLVHDNLLSTKQYGKRLANCVGLEDTVSWKMSPKSLVVSYSPPHKSPKPTPNLSPQDTLTQYLPGFAKWIKYCQEIVNGENNTLIPRYVPNQAFLSANDNHDNALLGVQEHIAAVMRRPPLRSLSCPAGASYYAPFTGRTQKYTVGRNFYKLLERISTDAQTKPATIAVPVYVKHRRHNHDVSVANPYAEEAVKPTCHSGKIRRPKNRLHPRRRKPSLSSNSFQSLQDTSKFARGSPRSSRSAYSDLFYMSSSSSAISLILADKPTSRRRKRWTYGRSNQSFQTKKSRKTAPTHSVPTKYRKCIHSLTKNDTISFPDSPTDTDILVASRGSCAKSKTTSDEVPSNDPQRSSTPSVSSHRHSSSAGAERRTHLRECHETKHDNICKDCLLASSRSASISPILITKKKHNSYATSEQTACPDLSAGAKSTLLSDRASPYPRRHGRKCSLQTHEDKSSASSPSLNRGLRRHRDLRRRSAASCPPTYGRTSESDRMSASTRSASPCRRPRNEAYRMQCSRRASDSSLSCETPSPPRQRGRTLSKAKSSTAGDNEPQSSVSLYPHVRKNIPPGKKYYSVGDNSPVFMKPSASEYKATRSRSNFSSKPLKWEKYPLVYDAKPILTQSLYFPERQTKTRRSKQNKRYAVAKSPTVADDMIVSRRSPWSVDDRFDYMGSPQAYDRRFVSRKPLRVSDDRPVSTRSLRAVDDSPASSRMSLRAGNRPVHTRSLRAGDDRPVSTRSLRTVGDRTVSTMSPRTDDGKSFFTRCLRNDNERPAKTRVQRGLNGRPASTMSLRAGDGMSYYMRSLRAVDDKPVYTRSLRTVDDDPASTRYLRDGYDNPVYARSLRPRHDKPIDTRSLRTEDDRPDYKRPVRAGDGSPVPVRSSQTAYHRIVSTETPLNGSVRPMKRSPSPSNDRLVFRRSPAPCECRHICRSHPSSNDDRPVHKKSPSLDIDERLSVRPISPLHRCSRTSGETNKRTSKRVLPSHDGIRFLTTPASSESVRSKTGRRETNERSPNSRRLSTCDDSCVMPVSPLRTSVRSRSNARKNNSPKANRPSTYDDMAAWLSSIGKNTRPQRGALKKTSTPTKCPLSSKSKPTDTRSCVSPKSPVPSGHGAFVSDIPVSSSGTFFRHTRSSMKKTCNARSQSACDRPKSERLASSRCSSGKPRRSAMKRTFSSLSGYGPISDTETLLDGRSSHSSCTIGSDKRRTSTRRCVRFDCEPDSVQNHKESPADEGCRESMKSSEESCMERSSVEPSKDRAQYNSSSSMQLSSSTISDSTACLYNRLSSTTNKDK